MAKLIPGIKLKNAKIAQFDEYMRDVLENAQMCPGIETYLPFDLAAFRTATQALHAVVSRPLRWELTPDITKADQELDKGLSALRYAMKAALENPVEEASEAAKVVLRMSEIDKITGGEQYDEETGKINAMITTLLGDYAEQTEQAGVMPYVIQLKQRSDRLCQLLQERDQLQGELGPHNGTELRNQTNTVYHKLVLDVNSVSNCIDLGIIQPSSEREGNPFTIFIDYMIGHIDRFHREVLHTTSSNKPAHDGADGEEESPGGEQGGEIQQPGGEQGGGTNTPSGPNTDAWGDGDEGDGSDV